MPRLSDYVVAVSEATRDNLCAGDGLNRQKAIVIHNGIETSRFFDTPDRGEDVRREWGIGAENPLVGMVGRLSHWKGQDHFLRAAQIVALLHPDVRFVLVGGTFPGQDHLRDGIIALVSELGLSSSVIVDDFRSDIPDVLRAYDVFVLPSTQPDPFPTVVLEAMAAAKAVVANAHGGCMELVEDQVTGILVNPANPEAMANAICFLLEHVQERLIIGRERAC